MPKGGAARLPIRLNRSSPDAALPLFTSYFRGFEKVGAVRSVFGERTDEILGSLRIGFIPNRGMYMGIRDIDGNIAVGTYHLRNSPTRTLYLDVVHELFHISQRATNGKWFHDEFMKFMQDRSLYYASPIEVPAYQHTVREAERIGMTKEEILQYLKFGNPPAKTWRNFVRQMNIKGPTGRRVTRFPVKIKRDAEIHLYRFTDYFFGFENVGQVREILGDQTEKTLQNLKVEFIDSPFGAIYPNEEDGHLVVANAYFRKGKTVSVYLDVFLCLNLIAKLSRESLLDPEAYFSYSSGVVRAYAAMVGEGRRLGLSDGEILGHLQLPRFMMRGKGFDGFLRKLGIKARQSG